MQKSLRSLRKEAGLSVAELARRTGLHPTTIFELEADKRPMFPKYRRVLSRELGLSEAQLSRRLAGNGSSEKEE